MEQESGRINIALSGPAEVAKDEIMRRFPFAERQQAIRVGLAYAIRCELEPVRGQEFGKAGVGQNLNIGSFDPNGELRAIIEALYPGAGDPYVIAETLMSLGLVQLWRDIHDGVIVAFEQLMYEDSHAG